ncbi:MAG: phosphoribosyl-ATP diphosphatase [Bacillota bacterium]|nr:phosphoribosyl-ATP diphosphatase [Bacillota bacterium]
MEIKDILTELDQVTRDRKVNPIEGSYTNYLFDKGLDKILKKVGEESTEVIIAAKGDNEEDLVAEICDLTYHLMVLMAEKNISLDKIVAELEKRHQKIRNQKPERKEIENL